MSPYSIICDGTGVMGAMKKSIGIVRKSIGKVLLLLVLLVLISLGIGLLVGFVLGLVTVAMPAMAAQILIGIVNSVFNGYLGVVMMAAFMAFYLALEGKEKPSA
jgi:membrane-anchored glycerophosphoryl diester phosphodiesterase (GDPDase)